MAFAKLQSSYAAGELSPSLYARVDLAKYNSGAALLSNWYVDYRGGTSTRPGSLYVGTSLTTGASPPRLIPFIVSTIATYLLELGDHYIRFVSNGAFVIDPGTSLPLVVASPYAITDVFQLAYTQSADVLTITHPSYPVQNLTRNTPTSFTLAPDVIGPSLGPPGIITAIQVNGADAKSLYAYAITAIGDQGDESAPSFPAFCLGSVLNQNTGIVNIVTFSPVAGANQYKIYKVGPTASGSGNTASPLPSVYGLIGSSQTTTFTDNNIAPDFSQTPPQFQDPFSPGQLANIAVSTPGSGYTGYVVQLIFSGDGTGAAGYGIVDPTAPGTVLGAVLTNPGKGYTFCTVSDAGANSAGYTVTIGQQTGTYPSAVGYFQQRRAFGGTNNFPESMVLSQPGAYNNFDTNPIQLDSDAITASLASRQVNYIKAFVPMPTGLVVFTTGGGFLVTGGGSANEAVTPANITAYPQASSGCNDLPPLVINYDILYGQNRGAVVRDFAFNFYVQSYTGTDRSVLASHLFYSFDLMDWTYAEEPFRLVQIVRSDGALLVMTYVPEQEIFAWTHYHTNGFYRSIASAPEGQVNATYVVVQRLVNGVWGYYIERTDNGLYNTLQNAWCVDCGLATPNNSGPATLYLSAIDGTGLTLTASAPTFNSAMVGYTLWANTGRATVTAFTDSTHLTVDTLTPFTPVSDDPLATPIPLWPNEWILNPNVTTLSGLDHLNGMVVQVVADGLAVGAQTVTANAVTLAQPASRVTVGLGYTCDFQSLKVDLGDPTVQGKRKIIPAVTVRANKTAGLTAGRTFSRMVPIGELIAPFPGALISKDARQIIDSAWEKAGQICIRQSLPLPATILGLIPEITVGDTQR